MYLRFTAPGVVTRARVAPGLFRPAGRLQWSLPADSPVKIAIDREIHWFNNRLPIPKRFGVKACGLWWSDGVCWFRDGAREVVAHAFTLAALIEEAGVPIDHIWTRDPGQILYRDDWQVVAKPERAMLL